MHLIRHIVDGMQQFGPVYATWMYGYERFNSWLHRRVTNRRYPEATLMETYRVSFSFSIHAWLNLIPLIIVLVDIIMYIWIVIVDHNKSTEQLI